MPLWSSTRSVLLFFALLLSAGCGDEAQVFGTTGGSGGAGASGGAGHGGAGGAGGEGRSCWEQVISEWESVEPLDLAPLTGQEPRDPMLSPDGLSLYYTARASLNAPYRAYRAERDDLDASFAGGELLASWTAQPAIGRPWWVIGGQLFFHLDEGSGAFRLAVSLEEDDDWGFPSELGSEINDPATHGNSSPTLTQDARRLLFVRNSMSGSLDLKLFEASRPSGEANEAFGSATAVDLPGISSEDLVTCPTISPDGRRLLFSTTHPHDITAGLPPGAVTVWATQRATVEDPWEEPIHLTAFDSASHFTCIYALRGDGCEVYLERFQVGEPASSFDVARR